MSNLEHLIENALTDFEQNTFCDMDYKDIINHIQNDENYCYAMITAEQCYEICQYVYVKYCANPYSHS